MSNMSYCRFQNTAEDFADCVNNLRSLDPADRSSNTSDERDARRRIIELAADLMAELGVEDPSDIWALSSIISDLDAADATPEE